MLRPPPGASSRALRVLATFIWSLLALSPRPSSAEPNDESFAARVASLTNEIHLLQQLQEDVARLRLETELPSSLDQERHGQGPVFSKAAESRSPLSFGATIELAAEAREDRPDRAGLLVGRGFVGYRFSANLLLHSALVIEAARPSRTLTASGSVREREPEASPRVDFLYVDWSLSDSQEHRSVLRTGLVPLPLGLRRLRPEPTLYADPVRPRLEEWVLPADSSRPGVLWLWDGNVTRKMALRTQVGLIAAPDAALYGDRSFISGGISSRVSNSSFFAADSPAAVGRIEAAHGGANDAFEWRIGLSALAGDTRHDGVNLQRMPLHLRQVDLFIRSGALSLHTLAGGGDLGGTPRLFSVTGRRPGSDADGVWAQLSGEVLRSQRLASLFSGGAFCSYEALNLSGLRPHGSILSSESLGNGPDRIRSQALRAGLYLRPVPHVIVNLARQWRLGRNNLDEELWTASLGLVF